MVKLIDMYLEESNSEKRTVMSSLRVLIKHMLKCKYQKDYPNKKSWRSSIRNSFNELYDSFLGRTKGSLYKKFYMKDLNLDDIYKQAMRGASNETHLSIDSFLEKCEWSKEQLVNFDFIEDFIAEYGQDGEESV